MQTIELVVFACSLLTRLVVVNILSHKYPQGIEESNTVNLESKNDSKIEQFLDVTTADIGLPALCCASYQG